MSTKQVRKSIKNNPSHISKRTLDIQHMNKIQEFAKVNDIISDLKTELNTIETRLHDFKNRQKSGYDPCEEEILDMLSLRDKKDALQKELDEQHKNDEVEYFVNTGPILFQYYDIVEKGTDDQMASNNEDGIMKFFLPASSNVSEEAPQQRPTIDRASLLEKYMWLTEDNYIKSFDCIVKDKCVCCGSNNLNVMLNEGIVHCNSCDSIEYIIIDHDRPSYKDPPKEVTYFSYKRINHLNEWISQIQGKETTDIPEEIYNKILLEIKKQKITNMADLTNKKIKEILRKLDSNKYYEHIPHIIHKLNGLPIPHFEPELEEKLRAMFKLIQPLFLKYAPFVRKNFLSYAYCLHKFIQLLGRDEYLPNLPLLKSREKLHQQDQIWKKICEELSWQFIRSL